MATERQIDANRRNSERSTGPRSPAGKARSRVNATKHGLAGESAGVEAGFSPEFEQRRARWADEQKPVGEEANWALDRLVASTFRIERCERAVDKHIESVQQRARLTWDEDNAIEAATILGRLERDPVLASCQLQASLAGVMLLIEAWLKLVSALESNDDWSESERSKALDLLGVAADLRSGRTPVDDPTGGDSVGFRRALVLEEVDRLEALRDEALIPLDEMDRSHALAGDIALLSRPAKLLLRYEREAWTRYRESLNLLKEKAATVQPNVVAPTPTPAVVKPPRFREQTVDQKGPSLEEERRALLAEAAPYVKEATDRLSAMGLTDEDAWLEELERRVAAGPGRASATERSQSDGVAAIRGS